MKAHYFASKAEKYLIISEGFQPVGVKHKVSGKAEAKKLAKQAGAEPHNF